MAISRTILTGVLVVLLIAATQARAGESKFLRFVPDDSGGPKLQTSVVTYRNADGVTVDLVGAVHIADRAYFQRLNDAFTHYDVVLYEMVKPRGAGAPSTRGAGDDDAPARPASGLSWVGTFQRFLKDNLALTFQLDEIDYERGNFVHADLDVEAFLQKQKERNESFLKLMLRAMLSDMTGRGDGKRPLPEATMGELITALRSPDRARQLKIVLAKQFEHMEDLLGGIEGPEGSVIITERNRKAMDVLKQRIKKGDRRIAIFYGAGHFKGMEETLVEEMGFTQLGEPKWMDAWDMTAPSTRPAR